MSSLKRLVLTTTIYSFFVVIVATRISAETPQENYFFYGNGCPHCATVEKYFEENDIFKKYNIQEKEVYFNKENALLFTQMMNEQGIPANRQGVPTLILDGEVIMGDIPIIAVFENTDTQIEFVNETTEAKAQGMEPKQKPNLTLAAVISASIVDAINPCAFAVLIILMTTILSTKDSKKALKAGLLFAAAIFISYFLMGLGIYKVLGAGKFSETFYKGVGWLAILLGLLNLKDYFWYGKGFLMEVPLSWRPKMKALIKSVTSPLGAFGIGFLVSLFLLPCTSGPYIVILGMLAIDTLQIQAISYLLLYNLIFVLPMVVISVAVFKGFNPTKAEETRQKHLKNLHLIAGIIMVLMGLIIVGGWI